MTPWPILPIFHPFNALSTWRSELHYNKVCGLTVAVNGSPDVTWGHYMPKIEECYNLLFCPQKYNGINAFSWEYTWLNVWHNISRQPCEISCWLQKNSYRKLCTATQNHVLRPNGHVTDDVTRPQKVKVPKSLRLNISTTVQNRRFNLTTHIQETIHCECYGHVTNDVRVPNGDSLKLDVLGTNNDCKNVN